MTINTQHKLQDFQDSPLALQAEFNLSASACESLSYNELLNLEDAVQENLLLESLGYPARHGSEELRRAISARYQGVAADGVIVGSGVDDSLDMIFSALVALGDRVVVLTPAYPPQLLLPRRLGAEVVPWAARYENDWVPDLDELRKLVEPKTSIVVVTFPQNPTGFMPNQEFVRELIDIVAEKGIVLVSDEIYSGLPHDSQTGVGRLVEHYEHAISIHGLSKTFSLPGLRVGWMVSRDSALIEQVENHSGLGNCYVPGPADYFARLALRHAKTIMARNGSIVRQNLDLANAFFSDHRNWFDWKPPMAGVLSFPKWLGSGGTEALSQQLLEKASLILVPSHCLEAGDDHVRISLSGFDFANALGRLEEYLRELPSAQKL